MVTQPFAHLNCYEYQECCWSKHYVEMLDLTTETCFKKKVESFEVVQRLKRDMTDIKEADSN